MLPCHSHIYGTWKSKEVRRGEVLKTSYKGMGGGGVKPQRGGGSIFMAGGVDPSRHHEILNLL